MSRKGVIRLTEKAVPSQDGCNGYKMGGCAEQHKKVPDFVEAKHTREKVAFFRAVNHCSNGVKDAPRQEPGNGCTVQKGA